MLLGMAYMKNEELIRACHDVGWSLKCVFNTTNEAKVCKKHVGNSYSRRLLKNILNGKEGIQLDIH
jgi:hypothetical protein